jgi:hypothetical protein
VTTKVVEWAAIPSKKGSPVWRTIDVRESFAAAGSPSKIYLPVGELVGSRRAFDTKHPGKACLLILEICRRKLLLIVQTIDVRFEDKEVTTDSLTIIQIMEMEVDLFLAGLASDSACWKRLGRVGTLNFVEGVLESLMGVGAITRDEALAWKELLTVSLGVAPARFSPSGGASRHPSSPTPRTFAHFIDLISADEPAKVSPGVCSFQIFGLELYDMQVAVLWRMLPVLDPEGTDELKNLAPINAGPEMSALEVSDDLGTIYCKNGGSSGGGGGGGGERVGRSVFTPAPPDGARILTISWEDMIFEIPLGSTHS